MKVQRMRYAIGFKFAESNLAACGISYNGEDEKGVPKWDRIKHLLLTFESFGNIQTKIQKWNISAA